jgi:hypothetical protein
VSVVVPPLPDTFRRILIDYPNQPEHVTYAVQDRDLAREWHTVEGRYIGQRYVTDLGPASAVLGARDVAEAQR